MVKVNHILKELEERIKAMKADNLPSEKGAIKLMEDMARIMREENVGDADPFRIVSALHSPLNGLGVAANTSHELSRRLNHSPSQEKLLQAGVIIARKMREAMDSCGIHDTSSQLFTMYVTTACTILNSIKGEVLKKLPYDETERKNVAMMEAAGFYVILLEIMKGMQVFSINSDKEH